MLDESGAKVAKIHFDCPWFGSNQVKTEGSENPDYFVAISEFNQGPSGPLGTGHITVYGQ